MNLLIYLKHHLFLEDGRNVLANEFEDEIIMLKTLWQMSLRKIITDINLYLLFNFQQKQFFLQLNLLQQYLNQYLTSKCTHKKQKIYLTQSNLNGSLRVLITKLVVGGFDIIRTFCVLGPFGTIDQIEDFVFLAFCHSHVHKFSNFFFFWFLIVCICF